MQKINQLNQKVTTYIFLNFTKEVKIVYRLFLVSKSLLYFLRKKVPTLLQTLNYMVRNGDNSFYVVNSNEPGSDQAR